MKSNLIDVHDAVQAAIDDLNESDKSVIISVRMHPKIRDAAEDVLRTNGVTMSAFLRKCCEGLLYDYVDPRIDN